jgi:hypothetical protein
MQVGVSCVCLILAVMLSRAGSRLEALDRRIDDRRMLAVKCSMSRANVSDIEVQSTIYQLENDMAQLPGIDGVARIGSKNRFESDGHRVLWTSVTPSYFQLMNLPVTRGRLFNSRERTLAVVSESLARAVWPDQDPREKYYGFAASSESSLASSKTADWDCLIPVPLKRMAQSGTQISAL